MGVHPQVQDDCDSSDVCVCVCVCVCVETSSFSGGEEPNWLFLENMRTAED
jgi:hypothetical protein